MKKQLIKNLAQSIVETNDFSQEVCDWVLKNLTRSELKSFVKYLKTQIKNQIVIVKYAGQLTQQIKQRVEKMFPNKAIEYVKADSELLAGIKFEYGDYILERSLSDMCKKLMNSIRENL